MMAHSTEEKRRVSLERYLLALTQVARGGSSGSDAPLGQGRHGVSSAIADGLRSTSSTSRVAGTLGSLGRSSPLLRTGSLLALANMRHKDEASVDDLLKFFEGHEEEVSEDEMKRLRWAELASFFLGPEKGDIEDIASWLRRGNVEEWVAHYWFRGATPEELQANRPREHEELGRLVDMVLEPAGLLHLPRGRNNGIRTFRYMTDPLPVQHRPLAVYLGTSLLCPMLTLQVMKMMGFTRERVGGLLYWKRQRRNDVDPSMDLAASSRTPLVFVHGLGVGLVVYFLFIYRLSQRHSGEMLVPEFPFLAMAPWESVPSAREVVAQLQDMLSANGHTAAHFCGHSFGSVVIGWVLKMSPSSVLYTTLLEPAQFLMIKAEALNKVLHGAPRDCYEMFVRYFAFRELFTVNLLCRNFFWEQSIMWPEDLFVPCVIELAGDDHIVQSRFVRRLLEHEVAARKQRRKARKKPAMPVSGSVSNMQTGLDPQQVAAKLREKSSEVIDILWIDGFFHGQILVDRGSCDKLFSKMKALVQAND